MISIPNKAMWPYVQQWHLDIQHEILQEYGGDGFLRGQQGHAPDPYFDYQSDRTRAAEPESL